METFQKKINCNWENKRSLLKFYFHGVSLGSGHSLSQEYIHFWQKVNEQLEKNSKKMVSRKKSNCRVVVRQ